MFDEFFDKKNVYAVVGASKDRNKYGNKVLRDLVSAGYKAVPVNPKEREIEELTCFENLRQAGKIDVVIFVVPQSVTETVLEEVKSLKIKKVWMQPGSESESAIDFCKKNGIECIHSMCIMLSRKNQGQD